MKYLALPFAAIASIVMVSVAWATIGPPIAFAYIGFAALAMSWSHTCCSTERLAPSVWCSLHRAELACHVNNSHKSDITSNVARATDNLERAWHEEIVRNMRFRFATNRHELMTLKSFAHSESLFEYHEPYWSLLLAVLTRFADGMSRGEAAVLIAVYRGTPIAVMVAERAKGMWQLPIHYVKRSMRSHGIGGVLLSMMLVEINSRRPGVVRIELPKMSPLSEYYAKFGFQPTRKFSRRCVYSLSRDHETSTKLGIRRIIV